MESDEVMKFFEEKYPGKQVFKLPNDNPKEIICEVEPSSEHPEYSVAVASIFRSSPHFHKISKETYKVLSGNLKLHVNDKLFHLRKGETHTVYPNETHWAEGDFSLVQVTSRPGWVAEDHFVTE